MMMTGFMTNFPILSIISLFLGAFITALVGRKNKIVRNTVVAIAVTLPLIMMFSLIKPIMVEGQTIGMTDKEDWVKVEATAGQDIYLEFVSGSDCQRAEDMIKRGQVEFVGGQGV